MKLQFIVNTRWDEAAMRVYAAVNQAALSTPLSRKVSKIAAVAILVFGVVVMVLKGFQLVYSLIIIIGLLLLFSQRAGISRATRRLTRALGSKSRTVDYRFGESSFEAAAQGGDSDRVAYEKLTRLVETKEYIFLFTAPGVAHILRKDDFTLGNSDGLLAFLAEKTGKQPEKLEL